MKYAGVILALLGLALLGFGCFRVLVPVEGVLSLGWKEAWHPGAFMAAMGILECLMGMIAMAASLRR